MFSNLSTLRSTQNYLLLETKLHEAYLRVEKRENAKQSEEEKQIEQNPRSTKVKGRKITDL